jgi:type III restriction enzyme
VNNLYKDCERRVAKGHRLHQGPRPVSWTNRRRGRRLTAGKTLDAMLPVHAALFGHHANKHHMVYRLDALDAYRRKLVKQIEGGCSRRRHKAFIATGVGQ